MAETMTTIRLYGKMGAMFGREHVVALDTKSPAEAVRWLCSQFPKAKRYLMSAGDDGIAFAVFRGKENIGREQLCEPAGKDAIRIAPVLRGSKRGAMQIILGVVIIAASLVADYFTGGDFGASTHYRTYIMGATMIAGGIVQMLTPVPHLSTGDAAENKPNYVFQGAVNTQAQGNPVPLLYGRMICGSAVISAAVKSEFYQPGGRTEGPGNLGRVVDGLFGWNPKTPYDVYEPEGT